MARPRGASRKAAAEVGAFVSAGGERGGRLRG